MFTVHTNIYTYYIYAPPPLQEKVYDPLKNFGKLAMSVAGLVENPAVALFEDEGGNL
jgi:hypothetical protein